MDTVTNMLAVKNTGFEMEGNSSQLENRVTRLETHVEHINSNISEIKADLKDVRADLKDFRASTDAKFDRVNDRISMLHVTMTEKFGEMNAKFDAKFGEIKVWALTVLGGGILAVVAHALHWL